MARLPSDPHFLLSYMEELDSEDSDKEFDGYVDSDEEREMYEEREMEQEKEMEQEGMEYDCEQEMMECDGDSANSTNAVSGGIGADAGGSDTGGSAAGGSAATRSSAAAGGNAVTSGSAAAGGRAVTRGSAAAGGSAATRSSAAAGGNAVTSGSAAAGGRAVTRGSAAAGGSAATRGSAAAGGRAVTRGSAAVGGRAATRSSAAAGGRAVTRSSAAAGGRAATRSSAAAGGRAVTRGSAAVGGRAATRSSAAAGGRAVTRSSAAAGGRAATRGSAAAGSSTGTAAAGVSAGAAAAVATAASRGIPHFNERVGLLVDMEKQDPINFFQQYFTADLNELILSETTRYANQYVASHKQFLEDHPRARAHQFSKKPFTQSDLDRFIALVIVMGVVNMPQAANYWNRRWPFYSTNISSVMTRDRFLLVLKFLHLVDNDHQIPRGQTGFDKLFKIRPLLDQLVKNWQSTYYPGREVSVDESMISFKGRLSFLTNRVETGSRRALTTIIRLTDTAYWSR